MVIFDYYQSLSRRDKTEFIKQVLVTTDMSHSTFFNKIKDNSFTKLEREAIERIINERKQVPYRGYNYQSLTRREKSEFIKLVLNSTSMALSTFFNKIKDNSFTRHEREAIERAINENKLGHDRED